MSVTSATQNTIVESDVLSSLVSVVAGQPAVFADVWAPDAPHPYVLLNSRSNRDPQTAWVRIGTLVVDVFDDGPSQERAIEIRDAIIEVIDSQHIIDENGDIYRIGEMGQDAPAPTEDSAITHRTFEFPVRFFRASRLALMS